MTRKRLMTGFLLSDEVVFKLSEVGEEVAASGTRNDFLLRVTVQVLFHLVSRLHIYLTTCVNILRHLTY